MNDSRFIPHAIICWVVVGCLLGYSAVSVAAEATGLNPQVHRSPVDLAISADGRWLVSANEIAGSVSLVDLASNQVTDETHVGNHPADVVFTPDGKRILVSTQWDGNVSVLSIEQGKLRRHAVIHVGFHPCGLAVTKDGHRAFVGLVASGQVAEIDLDKQTVSRRIQVGPWPRYVSLTQNDKRLAVGRSGDSKISVLDVDSGELLYDEPLANGINLGHMLTNQDSDYVYFPWMVYRTNPITVGNLRRGWILASRIGRVRLDGSADREAISLDVPGKAVADPHGIVISSDQKRMIVSASGTHELLVYRLPDTPFVATGGPGDLIDRRLQRDRDRFYRIPVGGRPLGMQMTDDQTIYVANYLYDSIQKVDISTKQIVQEIHLGGPKQPSLARRGMAIFYDGQRSLDQWYSCHSCHQNGGVNSRPMDTWNDGSEMTLKTVLPLYDVVKTKPWTWHGWQNDLDEAMHKSITSTMLGKKPSDEDKAALIAFLESMQRPPNPFRGVPELAPSIARGKTIFNTKAGCADCHNGPHYTDGEVHDVGLGSKDDFYDGYNTPSLVGTYEKVRWLHTGRARDLDRVVNDLHSPQKVSDGSELTQQESADLIAYLKSL